MPAQILATKRCLPPPRAGLVSRPRLIKRLNESLAAGRKLTLLSASAGFGKTTLLSEWRDDFSMQIDDFCPPTESAHPSPNQQSEINHPKSCWLSLDESDSDPLRFLIYLVSALQTIKPELGQPVLAAMQTPQPPSAPASWD